MSDNNVGEGREEMAEQEPVPMMQRLLDNPFLLLLLGILVPAVFYIIWGIIEITQIPIAESGVQPWLLHLPASESSGKNPSPR